MRGGIESDGQIPAVLHFAGVVLAGSAGGLDPVSNRVAGADPVPVDGHCGRWSVGADRGHLPVSGAGAAGDLKRQPVVRLS